MGGENESHVVDRFQEYATWLGTLKVIDDQLWRASIATGKWSVSEIVAHIMNWDKHILSKIIPSVKNGNGMRFPDFDTYNKKATDYAKSGISQTGLLKEAIVTRKLLVKELHKVPVEKLNKPLPANGVSHCPRTGEPYSLLYIMKEFIDHDQHHQAQVTEFLRENSLV